MIEIFKKILKDKKADITNEQVEKIFKDILAILLLEIVGKSEYKMNSEEILVIKSYFQDKQYEKIVDMVRNKYTKEEWDKLIESEAEVLLGDYLKNVIKK